MPSPVHSPYSSQCGISQHKSEHGTFFLKLLGSFPTPLKWNQRSLPCLSWFFMICSPNNPRCYLLCYSSRSSLLSSHIVWHTNLYPYLASALYFSPTHFPLLFSCIAAALPPLRGLLYTHHPVTPTLSSIRPYFSSIHLIICFYLFACQCLSSILAHWLPKGSIHLSCSPSYPRFLQLCWNIIGPRIFFF